MRYRPTSRSTRSRAKNARSGLTAALGHEHVNDMDIAAIVVRFFLEGAESDAWAPERLNELAHSDPHRAWEIIRSINATPIEGKEWQEHAYAALGCGAIEEPIVLHEKIMLPTILRAAESDTILRRKLSAIYESSVAPNVWAQICPVVAQ